MEKHLKVAHHIAKLLDSNFKIFGYKVGYDGILGLIPGVGDIVSFGFSFYLIWIGIQLGIPGTSIARMILNTLFDFLLGLLPVVGDVSDFFYRSNMKNYQIFKESYLYSSGKVIEGEKV